MLGACSNKPAITKTITVPVPVPQACTVDHALTEPERLTLADEPPAYDELPSYLLDAIGIIHRLNAKLSAIGSLTQEDQ